MISFITIALVGVFIAGIYSWRTYEVPREALVVGAAILIGLFQLRSLPFFIYLMLIWWLLSSLASKRSDIALKEFMFFCCAVLLAWMAVSSGNFRLGLQLIVLGALLNCIYGLAQNLLRWEPMKRSANALHHYSIGFVGNENMLGNWLIPMPFVMLWLGGWWQLGIPLVLLTIYRTRCRTAMVGLAIATVCYISAQVGWVFALVDVAFFGLMFWLLVVVPKLITWGESTLKERTNYWRIALDNLPKASVLGLGFNVVKVMVPFSQRHLNESSNGKFLAPHNYKDPYPQRVHNDYLQMVLDIGLLGAILTWFLPIMAVILGWGDPLSFGLVGLLIAGLGFHCFSIRPINVIIWVLTFYLLTTHSILLMLSVAVPAWAAFPLLITLAYRYTFRWTMFDITFQKYFRTQNIAYVHKALRWWPTSSAAHTWAGRHCVMVGDTTNIFNYSIRALTYNDGEQRMWELWNNLGTACAVNGAFGLAAYCSQESLNFWPHYETAKKSLEANSKLALTFPIHMEMIKPK